MKLTKVCTALQAANKDALANELSKKETELFYEFEDNNDFVFDRPLSEDNDVDDDGNKGRIRKLLLPF